MISNVYVTIEKLIPAARPTVFQAWLDPSALARFMCPGPGTTVTKAESDARVGGRFLIVMRVGGQDRPHQGEYLIIEPHERLQFTWHSHAAPPDSQVTLTFEEAGEGKTLIKLVHAGLPTDKARAAHDFGWTAILDILATMPNATTPTPV